MNRREFVGSAVAGAALLARGASVLAADAKYDLVIKGGRVIDPSLRVDAVRDVGVAGGRVVAIEPSISAAAAETLDARGKLVVPGLIDIHTHAARDKAGPPMCLADGVTGWIDAGSAGADNLEPAIAVAMGSAQPGRILVNIGRTGIIPEGDTKDLALADVGAARAAIERHRDYVVGVKARLSKRRGQERLRGAAPDRGSRRALRSSSDDPHGPDGVTALEAAAAAQARRHRHAHVRAAAERNTR